MSYFIFDVEADGPCPHMYSMVSFGVVLFRDPNETFFGQVMPISQNYLPEVLAVSGVSREDHLTFPRPEVTMRSFVALAETRNEPGTKMVLA